LKKELIYRNTWPRKDMLRGEIFEFIEVFYNRRRRHSTLGMLSPADYENRTRSDLRTGLAASRLEHDDNIINRATALTITA
jgi:transposase InsO family protein